MVFLCACGAKKPFIRKKNERRTAARSGGKHMGKHRAKNILWSILAVCMLLTAAFAALFAVQPKKAEATTALAPNGAPTDTGSEIFILDSVSDTVKTCTTQLYGTSGQASGVPNAEGVAYGQGGAGDFTYWFPVQNDQGKVDIMEMHEGYFAYTIVTQELYVGDLGVHGSL